MNCAIALFCWVVYAGGILCQLPCPSDVQKARGGLKQRDDSGVAIVNLSAGQSESGTGSDRGEREGRYRRGENAERSLALWWTSLVNR
jgi:hypothetical protein